MKNLKLPVYECAMDKSTNRIWRRTYDQARADTRQHVSEPVWDAIEWGIRRRISVAIDFSNLPEEW